MIGNLTASEQRLNAALDRIDDAISRTAEALSKPAAAPQTSGSLSDDEVLEALAAEQDELRKGYEGALARQAELQAQLDEMHKQLSAACAQAEALATANEALTQANRQLLSRADSGGAQADDIRAALEAELDALRSVRSAEIGRITGIIDALDRMIGTPRPQRHDADPHRQPAASNGVEQVQHAQESERG